MSSWIFYIYIYSSTHDDNTYSQLHGFKWISHRGHVPLGIHGGIVKQKLWNKKKKKEIPNFIVLKRLYFFFRSPPVSLRRRKSQWANNSIVCKCARIIGQMHSFFFSGRNYFGSFLPSYRDTLQPKWYFKIDGDEKKKKLASMRTYRKCVCVCFLLMK